MTSGLAQVSQVVQTQQYSNRELVRTNVDICSNNLRLDPHRANMNRGRRRHICKEHRAFSPGWRRERQDGEEEN